MQKPVVTWATATKPQQVSSAVAQTPPLHHDAIALFALTVHEQQMG